jgi:hypothetical protein
MSRRQSTFGERSIAHHAVKAAERPRSVTVKSVPDREDRLDERPPSLSLFAEDVHRTPDPNRYYGEDCSIGADPKSKRKKGGHRECRTPPQGLNRKAQSWLVSSAKLNDRAIPPAQSVQSLDELKQQIPLMGYLQAHDWHPTRDARVEKPSSLSSVQSAGAVAGNEPTRAIRAESAAEGDGGPNRLQRADQPTAPTGTRTRDRPLK